LPFFRFSKEARLIMDTLQLFIIADETFAIYSISII
jgi:hypothetical protein